jgi:hypothetical protein
MAPPNVRSPAAPVGGAGRAGNIKALAGVDVSENSNLHRLRQAQRIRQGFGLSWPHARAVAEIAFAVNEEWRKA